MKLTLIALAILGFGWILGMNFTATLASPNANSQNNPTTMHLPSQPNSQAIRQLIERQAEAWETADSEQLIADFAEDSLFVVPGSTFRGKQQIKAAAERYFAEFTATDVTIKRIIVNGNEGAVTWSWRDTTRETGENSFAEDAIIFELEAGKLKYWREYIDTQPQSNL